MTARRNFHIMVKPIGPICNLSCDYCFYLEKVDLFPEVANFRMQNQILEQFIKSYIQSQPGPVVSFAWQGGEPALMGLDFYKEVVDLQRKHLPAGWQAANAFQTNGTLLDESWARFFKEENFLVGVSLDGPAELHDLYRRDPQGNPTWERVAAALNVLQKHQVETNVLAVINHDNGARPIETYQSLRDLGAEFIQFIPLVEQEPRGKLSAKSVSDRAWGRFLISVFNLWLEEDLGSVFVQIFEETLRMLAGLPPAMCVFMPECGRQLVMEHNGDLYTCDHYVEPAFRLGNITEQPLLELVESDAQQAFGLAKGKLPQECLDCPVLNLCRGECPKNRDAAGLNYLCAGYKQFFLYVQPFLKIIAATLRRGQPALAATTELKELLASTWDVKRNDLCPCGSGLKYKRCCEEIR